MVYAYFPRLKERRLSLAGYVSGGEQQMVAIGRALMSAPKMVLLDEPSMGLAPQLVEEIFEIVKRLNGEQGVSVLLAEQNTNMALRYATYGYILENGRVVMDGDSKSLRENEDVKEFYLGVGGSDRKSFRDVKSYKRRKRWLACCTGPGGSAIAALDAGMDRRQPGMLGDPDDKHYDQLETRDPAQRELAQFNLLPDLVRLAMAKAPGWAEHLEGRRCRCRHLARGARQAAGAAQEPRSRTCRPRARPTAASRRSPAGALARIFMSPGPIFEPEGFGEDWWRTARALFAAGMRKGDIVHNTFAYHLTPGGWILDAGARALGCAVIAAGPGNTEQQLEVIQYAEADGLRRRARLSQDPARQGQGGRQGRLLLQEGAGRRRRAVSLAAGRIQAARHRHLPDLCHRRSRHHRLREPGARRHDRRRGRASSRSCGRAPAIRCRRARSARSSSPPSTATIR